MTAGDGVTVSFERLGPARDARGSVVELLAPDEIVAQRNVHVVWTEPGRVRGNHFHARGTEVMIVWGPALVRLREAGAVRDVEVPDDAVYRFVIPPGVSHAVMNTGARQQLVVAFNTVAHDPAAPDVVPDILIAG